MLTLVVRADPVGPVGASRIKAPDRTISVPMWMEPVPTYREFHALDGDPRLYARLLVGTRSPETLM
jgi:hypothetical protein